MQSICFVCEGNTCRSPFAEKIFSKYLKQAKIEGFKVSSCGICADTTQNINDSVVAILKNYKITVKSRKAKKLTKATTKKYDLFITMTRYQKSFIDASNVFSFGEMIGGEDIPDPYGQNFDVYTKVTSQIEYYCRLLVDKIIKLKGN